MNRQFAEKETQMANDLTLSCNDRSAHLALSLSMFLKLIHAVDCMRISILFKTE
jgi:hypothetical protein